MTTDSPPTVRVQAHAKINLNLRVIGRRADLYHDLRTVFQAIALHDTLWFTPRPGRFVIECDDARLAVDSTNLVWRAADLLWQHLHRDGAMRDVAVRLEKRIPMKAGLGGGSADAAASLLALARLWQPQLPEEDVAALGARLGADVAFFVAGGAALGLGRGDQIHPLADLPPLGVLLVFPSFDVSTADAYRWWDERDGQVGETGQLGRVAPPDLQRIPNCPWPPPDCEIVNDLEPIVCARHPHVRELACALRSAGARAAAMTGSGSTVFGLFDRDDVLVRAERVMADAGHRVARTRTLTRAEYRARSAPACL